MANGWSALGGLFKDFLPSALGYYGMSQLGGRADTPNVNDLTQGTLKGYTEMLPEYFKMLQDEAPGMAASEQQLRERFAPDAAALQYRIADKYLPMYGQMGRDESYYDAMSDAATGVDVLRGPGGAMIDEAFAKAQQVDPEFYRGRAQTGRRLGELLESFADPRTQRPTTYWGEGDDRPQYTEDDAVATAAYKNAASRVQAAEAAYKAAQASVADLEQAATKKDFVEGYGATGEGVAAYDQAISAANTAAENLRAARESLTESEGAFSTGGLKHIPEGAGEGSYAVNVGDVRDYGDPFGSFTGALSGSEEEMIQRGLSQQGVRTGAATGPQSMQNVVSNAMMFGQGVQNRRDALGRALGQATSFLPASRSGFDPFKVAMGRPSTSFGAQQFTQPTVNTQGAMDAGSNVFNAASANARTAAGYQATQPSWLSTVGTVKDMFPGGFNW